MAKYKYIILYEGSMAELVTYLMKLLRMQLHYFK